MIMYDKTTDIAALITSRICHDLASPLGAICNGLELLGLSDINHMPEISLLNESVDAANARLQFFRIAYGTVAEGAMIMPDAVQQIIRGYLANKKTQAYWEHPQAIPRIDAKLMLLLVQCLETALPYGGEIYLDLIEGTWQLRGYGQLKIGTPIWSLLSGEDIDAELLSSQVHFEMARALAADTGKAITINYTEDEMFISINSVQ